MSDLKMGTAEARFADIIWEREPITSGQIAKIGAEEFNWKKSTSHTVLRRLCERGLFKNEDGTVTSLISREEYYTKTVLSLIMKECSAAISEQEPLCLMAIPLS